MEYRIERDSMGEMQVPADRYWAAQTQRSYQNFKIGIEKMPTEIVHAFGILKKGAAIANFNLGKLDEERKNIICQAADDVISGKLMDHFLIQTITLICHRAPMIHSRLHFISQQL